MSSEFEWHAQKARDNLAKHGVSFEEASTVFENQMAAIFPDEAHSTLAETREIIVGHSAANRLLIVVFAERGSVVRIVSARRATGRERREYEAHVARQR
jgi:uncharacterized DUF497 family protein